LDHDRIAQLRMMAQKALLNAYAPYSNYLVGSAVLMSSGHTFSGCNVENVSYGATVCAERVAIFSAVANGQHQLELIYICTKDGAPPCGICRQVMKEFGHADTLIVLGRENGAEENLTLEECFPHAFESSCIKSFSKNGPK